MKLLPLPPVPRLTDSGFFDPVWMRWLSALREYCLRLMPQLGNANFIETSTHTAAANTPTAMSWELNDGVESFVIGSPTSRLVCVTEGRYNFQFSVQLDNSDTASDNVLLWFRLNGADVANTNGFVAVPPKHGTTNGATIAGWNIFLDTKAGDYVELMWMTVGGTSRVVTYPASVTPAYPQSPGAIMTIAQVALYGG